MSIEVLLLTLCVPLGFIYLFAAVLAATRQRGKAWNVGNREERVAPLTGAAFRLDQAFQNFRETFPLFAVAVLVLAHMRKGGFLSELGAHLYFWARVAYLPIYARGIVGVRTFVWMLSVVGILLVWGAIWS